MNKIKSFIIVFSILLAQNVLAQLSKEEQKALKSELKSLKKNLAKFKGMKTETADLDKQVVAKQASIGSQEKQLGDLDTELLDKDRAIASLQSEIKNLKDKKKEVNAANIQGRFKEGATLFTIQIGSYVQKDLSQYMEQDVNFRVETFQNEGDGKSYKRYLLGFFQGNPKGYWEAKYFAEYLAKSMNEVNEKFKPFVVGYKQGKFVGDIIKEMSEYFL